MPKVLTPEQSEIIEAMEEQRKLKILIAKKKEAEGKKILAEAEAELYRATVIDKREIEETRNIFFKTD